MQNGRIMSGGSILSQLQWYHSDIQKLGFPKHKIFSSVGIFLPESTVGREAIDFPVKLVDLCTRIPNFKAKYLQNSPKMAGIFENFLSNWLLNLPKSKHFAYLCLSG